MEGERPGTKYSTCVPDRFNYERRKMKYEIRNNEIMKTYGGIRTSWSNLRVLYVPAAIIVKYDDSAVPVWRYEYTVHGGTWYASYEHLSEHYLASCA